MKMNEYSVSNARNYYSPVTQVYIDGPYGTATRGIFQSEHAVLIGAGIGVTPFASILQSVMYRYRAAQQTCPMCQHTWLGNIPPDMMRLKKVRCRFRKWFYTRVAPGCFVRGGEMLRWCDSGQPLKIHSIGEGIRHPSGTTPGFIY